VILVFSAFSVTSVSAVPPPLHRLPGQRINIATGEGTEFLTGETTHIVHGVVDTWSNMTLKQKIEFVLTADFDLFINGRYVRLRPYLWYDREMDDMYILWVRVFEPYTFPPGSYEFKGIWYYERDGVPESFENTVTVTVLP